VHTTISFVIVISAVCLFICLLRKRREDLEFTEFARLFLMP